MKKLSLLIVVLLSLIITVSTAEAGKVINEYLPDWIRIDLQLRHRYEGKKNFDFDDSKDDKKGFNLWRTRLNILLNPYEGAVKLFYQFQDSRISHDSLKGSKAGFEDWAETRQLWLQLKSELLAVDQIGLTAAGVRVGRQELSYGAQRLIGGFNWSNIAQTFDAGKVILEFDDADLNVDFFMGGKTPNKSPRESDDFYDGSSNDRIAGYYAVYKGLENTTIEQYFINRDTDGKTVSYGQMGDGAVEDYTIGGRIKGKISDSRFDYEIEAAKQFGNSGSLDVDAEMLVLILGYTFDHDWKPRVSIEYDFASGDENPTDGNRETFDNLYPTNHLYYGYMDFVSLQNINNYRIQLKANPTKKITVQSDYHIIYLSDTKDNLYSAGRGIKRATAPGADSFVGTELDLLVKYKPCAYANFLVGYSHFFAGDYLEDTGSADDGDFFYVQTVLNF